MGCSGVPDDVRADLLSGERWRLPARLGDVPLHHGVDAKAGHWLTITVDEKTVLGIAAPCTKAQLLHGGWPQWTGALLVAFAENADGTAMPIDIGNAKFACFGCACP